MVVDVPPHERLVDGGFQLEDVVADSQIVFQPEGRQQDSVTNGERQPQLVIFCKKQKTGVRHPSSLDLERSINRIKYQWIVGDSQPGGRTDAMKVNQR